MKTIITQTLRLFEGIHPLPQNTLILRMQVRKTKEDNLRVLLSKINDDVMHNPVLPFAIFKQIHFARFLLLEGPEPNEKFETSLFFIANIDGEVTAFINELLTHVSRGLDQIFESCINYPTKSKRSRKSRSRYLNAHRLSSQADYVNTIGRNALLIHKEDELRDSLQQHLNSLDPNDYHSVLALRTDIIRFVAQHPDTSWALACQKQSSLLWKSIETVRFVLLGSVGIGLLICAWPLLLAWAFALRLREYTDPEESLRANLKHIDQLRSVEDISTQNPFAAVGYLKPGLLRQFTVRALLPSAQFILRHIFNRGNLAGIPLIGLEGVDTIHFAHWILIDNDQRLLFTSNYDGSLESYMVDFIDKVAWGLNLIFSNGKGYPRTRWLIHEGARKEQDFKDYLGNHQIVNQVWFSAYPHLTAVNIANNEAIHEGLHGNMNEAQARAWLQRL